MSDATGCGKLAPAGRNGGKGSDGVNGTSGSNGSRPADQRERLLGASGWVALDGGSGDSGIQGQGGGGGGGGGGVHWLDVPNLTTYEAPGGGGAGGASVCVLLELSPAAQLSGNTCTRGPAGAGGTGGQKDRTGAAAPGGKTGIGCDVYTWEFRCGQGRALPRDACP